MTPTTVLCFSGHDPSGGAGIQADIETLISHQCHPCTVITALTEQDSANINKLIPQQAENVLAQARLILKDMSISAIKIGLLASVEIAQAVKQILIENPNIPVILDPVLAAGGGTELANDELINAINQLLPLVYIITPNSVEARRLTNETDLESCGLALLKQGCDYVLITGEHEGMPTVTNQLFHEGKLLESFQWNRLPEKYHGSGCTLATSIAAMTALKFDPFNTVLEAQEYTWSTLEAACPIGKGQHIPNRLFWMEDNP